MQPFPLLIEFVRPTTLIRERHRESALRILGNGPPGTFVAFGDGLCVSLPTDQIVFAEDVNGFAAVAFGGMQFVGVDNGQLICLRVREVLPDSQLSPDRSYRMQLDPSWIASIVADGVPVWPEAASSEL